MSAAVEAEHLAHRSNRAPFRRPVQFLAFGFGSGLSPRAPGTAGTIGRFPIYWLIADWGLSGTALLCW